MPDTPVLSVLLVLISPAIGSFLAVLADRLPRGESIVYPRSACRSCTTTLGLRDLIPVVSFVFSAGRCRHCGARIPPWHLYAEIATIGLTALVVIAGGPPLQMTLGAVLMWLLLALVLSDLLWFRLPDGLTGALLLVALAQAALVGDPATALIGAALGAGSFWALRVAYKWLRNREGLGLGDVKLMAGLGAMTGPWDLPLMVLLAALMALAVAVAQRLMASRPGALSATRPLPFGAALCTAAALLWLVG